ncbi:MAG: PQQ-binding-like beta-propeller repeat protein [Verrucomicrobia bacterium]|nr:PQQ-binding-like beta-propeller repeat protein [Verrucomicrobiota bacterium]
MKSIRWWPAILILIAAACGLVWIWGWYGDSRQDRIVATAPVIFGTIVLLLLWLVLFSRARSRIRWTVLGGVVSALVVAVGLFRISGVTGDLLPILEFRWKRTMARPIEPAEPSRTTSEVKPSAFDSPQFLGPNRNAMIAGPKLSRDWAANPPSLLWRQPIGAAWSGFAVVGDHAVTQEQRGEDEMVVCYDLNSGKVLWSHSDRTRYFTTIAGEGPRATPTIVSNHVYTLGATGILNCLELGDGKLVWSKDIIADNQSHVPEWGLSGSPLVVDDLVVVSAGGRDGRSLVAYDRETGRFAWGGGTDGAGYSSPYLTTLGGARQVLIFNAHSIVAHAVDSGKALWEYPWPGGHPHVALPVILPGDQVLVSSGYGTGSELLRIQSETNWLARRVWKSTRLKAKFTNVVFREGCIYGLDDGILVCLDASDGTLKWKEGRYGHGQVILVNELLLVMAESGEVILIQPVPEEHRKLAAFRALNGKTWNPPALAGEFLLVRNDKEAACYRMPLSK